MIARSRLIAISFLLQFIIGMPASMITVALADISCGSIETLDISSGRASTQDFSSSDQRASCYAVDLPDRIEVLTVELEVFSDTYDLYFAWEATTSQLSEEDKLTEDFPIEPANSPETFAFLEPSEGLYIIAVAPRSASSSEFILQVNVTEKKSSRQVSSESSGRFSKKQQPLGSPPGVDVQIGRNPQARSTLFFNVTEPGQITAQATWTHSDHELRMVLYGPGSTDKYVWYTNGVSSGDEESVGVVYNVRKADLQRGNQWKVVLENLYGGKVENANIELDYPVGSRVYFRNECNQAVKLALRYKTTSGYWVTDGWWRFEPHEHNYLGAGRGRKIRSNNSIFYYYAETTEANSSIRWSGKYYRYLPGRELPMRKKKLSRDDEGDYILSLTCTQN